MVKHTQTIRHQLPTNCLRLFHHSVGLALERLMQSNIQYWKLVMKPRISKITTPLLLLIRSACKLRCNIFWKINKFSRNYQINLTNSLKILRNNSVISSGFEMKSNSRAKCDSFSPPSTDVSKERNKIRIK